MALASTARGSGSLATSNTTLVVTPATYPAAGSTLVLVHGRDNSGASGVAAVVTSVVDSKGNTWTRQHQTNRTAAGAANDGVTLEIWVTRQNVGTLASPDTITFTLATATANKTWALWEITAGASLYPQFADTGTGGTGASTTPSVTSNSIPTGDLIIGAVAYEYGQAPAASDTDTSNGSWSTRQNANVGTTTTGGSICTQTKVATGAGTQTYNPTYTNSSDWAAGWISIFESPIDVRQMSPSTAGISVASFTITLSSNPLAGSTVFVGGQDPVHLESLSGLGATWTLVKYEGNNGGDLLWRGDNCDGTSAVITYTCGSVTASPRVMIAVEAVGLDNPSLDNAPATASSTSAAPSGPAVTTSQIGALVIGQFDWVGAQTIKDPGGGFTFATQAASGTTKAQMGFRVVRDVAAYTFSATLSGSVGHDDLSAAFKVAAAAADQPYPYIGGGFYP